MIKINRFLPVFPTLPFKGELCVNLKYQYNYSFPIICFIISEFPQRVASNPVSQKLRKIISNLFQLMAISLILEVPANFLSFANLQFSHLDQLAHRRGSLLSSIRPLTVPLVDSFDFRDEVLRSTLVCLDGWVYHRLFQAAARTPLNMMGGKQEGVTEQLNKKHQSKL